MNIRKLASVGLTIATVVVTLTGVFLFFNIGDHRLMVLTHDVFSITFILFVLIHMFINFRLLLNYLSARKELVINIAVAVIFTGAIAYSTTNRQELAVSDYPSVMDISLEAVLAADGVDYDEAIALLEEKGFKIPEGELTIEALTEANQMNPKVIYGTMTMNKSGAELQE